MPHTFVTLSHTHKLGVIVARVNMNGANNVPMVTDDFGNLQHVSFHAFAASVQDVANAN